MKAIHDLPLLLLLTLLSTVVVAASPSCAATTFIKTTCNSTTYPDLCDKICLPYANKIKCDLQTMAIYTLKAALGPAKNSLKTVSDLSKENWLGSFDKSAVNICVEVVDDSVDMIQKSIGELGGLENARGDRDKEIKLDNLRTWMSACETNYDTCLYGLNERPQETNSNLKSKITATIQDSSMYSSISLDLISGIQ